MTPTHPQVAAGTRSRKARIFGVGTGAVVLAVLSFVAIYFFSFVFNEPSYEELASEATAIARSASIDQEPQRYDQTGAVLEGSIPESRISVRRASQPDEAFNQLVQIIEQRGYTRIEGISPGYPLTGSWRKENLRIDVYVDGASGGGIQSIGVGLTVKEYKKS